MLSTVRQIGNSRGVLIPAAFLALCQIEDQVDMRFEDGAIIIKPVKATLRAGWFTSSAPLSSEAMQQESEAAVDWDRAAISDDSEWQW